MSVSAEAKPKVQWEDVALSFVPHAKRTIKERERLAAYRLPAILVVQVILTLRLHDIASNDEALYIRGGHVAIANLLHGGAANAALMRFDGSFFSGAPNAYPIVAAALDSAGGLLLTRLLSLLLMIMATVCVYKIGRHLFSVNVGLLASLIFALTPSVQYIGNYATYDAPCVALLALATAIAITGKSISSAPIVGALLALATVTKYAGLALVPFVLLMAFAATLVAPGGRWTLNFPRALLRGGTAMLVCAGLLGAGYYLWGSGIAGGIKFNTLARHALDPQPLSFLLKSLIYDVGLTYVLAIGGIFLLLRARAWDKVLLTVIMLGAGSVVQASSLRIHEFTSLDKHTAFTGLFCALPAAVALNWALSKRGRSTVLALVVIWLLLVDGLWRSNLEYSWPSSIMEPVKEIKTFNISGEYFSFDADSAGYYTEGDSAISWYPAASAFSLFSQGLSQVVAMEKSHQFTGFLFQTTNLGAQDLSELDTLQQLLATDPYYNRTSTFRVSPYTKAVWELWIHYPPGYHAPHL